MIKSPVQSAVEELTRPGVPSLEGITETWEELNDIKNTIANGVLEFVGSVETIRETPEIISNLGSNQAEFDKLLNVFYTDIDEFTKQMQALMGQHSGKTGTVQSMEELQHYSALSMQYMSLGNQLTVLIGPTVGQLMLLINEAVPVATETGASQNV